jgi:hypothetical protein
MVCEVGFTPQGLQAAGAGDLTGFCCTSPREREFTRSAAGSADQQAKQNPACQYVQVSGPYVASRLAVQHFAALHSTSYASCRFKAMRLTNTKGYYSNCSIAEEAR